MPSAASGFRRVLLSILLLGIGLATATPAQADAGPKPEMWIRVSYEGKALTDEKFDGVLLVCRSEESLRTRTSYWNTKTLPGLEQLDLRGPDGCLWTYPEMPVWGGNGTNGEVYFGYMLPSKFRVALYVPSLDRIFVTPEASRSGLRARFDVDLAADGTARIGPAKLSPWESDWTIAGVCIALPLTLLIELAIVFLWARRARADWRVLLVVAALANVVTLTAVWLVAGFISLFAGGLIALASLAFMEIFAVVVEGILYWKPGNLRFFSAMALALVANLVSFAAGVFVH